MGKDKTAIKPVKKPLPEKVSEGGHARLSEEDQQFLARIETVVGTLAKDLGDTHLLVAKFNEKFRANRIPKSKLPTAQNAVDRLAKMLGEDNAQVKALRQELAASELATNEVGEMFDLQKRLKKASELFTPSEAKETVPTEE